MAKVQEMAQAQAPTSHALMECLAELEKASQVKPLTPQELEFQQALAEAQAPKPKVKSGLKAITGAPTRSDLPEVKATPKDHAGVVVERYIQELLDAGHVGEAGAIGNLYNRLVRGNWIRVPDKQLLLGE